MAYPQEETEDDLTAYDALRIHHTLVPSGEEHEEGRQRYYLMCLEGGTACAICVCVWMYEWKREEMCVSPFLSDCGGCTTKRGGKWEEVHNLDLVNEHRILSGVEFAHHVF